MSDTIKITVFMEDDDGEFETEVAAPGCYEVCPRCRGKGTHVHPDVDGHGLTAADFAEDPDFEEAYFAGRYDVPCHECGGKRVVFEIDWDEFRRQMPEEAKAYDDQLRSIAEMEHIERMERRMGA